MSRIIIITSGKGGVGKTTTAINLGAAINYFGENVIVIDANLTTPNVGIHLGSPEVPINLNHVLLEKADLCEAIYEHSSGLKILPSSLSVKELSKLKPSKLKSLKKGFSELADYIIVDSAAGLGEEALSAVDMADEIIIITNPEMPAVTDALKLIKLAEQRRKPITGIIVTRVRKNKSEMQPDAVKDMLNAPILGMIPEDILFQVALKEKDAIVHTHPKSTPARAYKEIAANLTNNEYNSSKDKERLMRRILKKFGLK